MHIRTPELRLFISSTFVDFTHEREYLVKHIFPEIRVFARERGVEFTEIDLRWGITAQEAEEGKTIRTCLAEVDRCRPYFIGLLGSRYGWQPTPEDITKDAELLEQFPWVKEAVASGMSVTEMEMSYGALTRLDDRPNAFFYLRKSTEEPDEHIQNLQKRIRSSGYAMLDGFDNVEELGAQVRTDMLRLIEEQFPASAEPSPLEIERRANDAYAHTRRRAYVPNPAYLKRLTEFADDPDPERKPLVVVGKSGGGKSSLLAYWSNEYHNSHPDVFVTTHYVGAAHSSPASLIRHLMMEIKERGKFDDAIPEQADELERDLPQWLAKLPDEKVVIVLDAVNQLEDPRGYGLNWLPSFIPPNIRLILSTTDDVYGATEEEHTLAHRNWETFVVQQLTAEQRHEVTKHYLSQYHKTLTRAQLEALATSEKCASPLFLRTVLEELRIFGKYREIDERIAHYLASADTDELFQRVLERMEEDYDASVVREVLSLIWASRHGLSETELLGVLSHVNRYELSRLLHALDFHLIRNAGLLKFFHAYLRRAVETRYLGTDDEKQSIHKRLAEYFSTLPADNRRADEEPCNWERANDAKGLERCLSDVPLLLILLEEKRRQEIIGYWKMLKEHVSLKEKYRDIANHFSYRSHNIPQAIHFYKMLGDALTASSEYEIAETLLRESLELALNLYGQGSIEVANSKTDLGTLLYFTSKFDEAEVILTEALAVKKETLSHKDISYAKTLNDLGTILYSTGQYRKAEDAFREVISIYNESHLGDRRETADTLINLGTVLFIEKQYSKAKKHFLEALTMIRKIYGGNHISLIPYMSNLAMVEERLGDVARSESYRKEVIKLSVMLYGRRSAEVCHAQGNLGVFYSRHGRLEEALILHEEAQAIRKEILGEGHKDTINGYVSVGSVLLRLNKVADGILLYKKYLPVLRSMVGDKNILIENPENLWKEFDPESYRIYKSNPTNAISK